jgi:hypothetical protein
MSISNYPNGFPGGVEILGLPILNTYAGNVFWVDSATGSNGNKGTRTRPFATLDYAIGRCTANKGDIILVAPNHAETITGAGGITADVAGITIIGLGSYNQRPRFLMDGADTVSFVVSAADATVKNLVFASGFSDVVTCFNITAAGCWIDGCEFADNTTDENWLTPIKATSTVDGNANGLKVTNCRWVSPDAGSLEFIEGNADILDVVVRNNVVIHEGTASPLILMATGKDLKRADIMWNFLSHKMTANELFVNIDTTGVNNSGFIAHNRVRHADVTTTHDLGIDDCGFGLFDNLSTSVNNLSGVIVPAADTDG